MSRTTWIVFIALCIGLLGGLVLLSRGAKLNVDNVDQQQVQQGTSENGDIKDHVFGSTDPLLTIIEYGDYQCPACASAAPTVKTVSETYKDKGVQLIFRNFPLTNIHPNALAAAAAAEAAGLQGKFWEMHDKLYSTQSAWERLGSSARTDVFAGYAASLGIDTQKFTIDLTSDAVAKKIDFDTALARKAGAKGTPTIFVNGELVSDLRVQDGKAVSTSDTNLPYVWTSVSDFEKLVIQPTLDKINSSK